ncbi:MAG TPA: glycosyltransferase family 2 protein [Sedimentisphaerales bacterium]|nr:glycosyltransferase family 2 protein [Sedimentisphaerales bacterium]HNU29429.1 glycosyltransferase family 2 protein [Sedimentisphaerales bacterium]
MSRPDVTVVVVSWNTREILRDCLRSVYENGGAVRCQVIVVDNASADGSAEMVRSEFPEVQLIANADNLGFAAANNQGMAMAGGRYVLLLNSDTVVLDGAIAKTVAFADAHPDVAVVGCRVMNPDRTLQPTCFMYPSLLNMVLSATYLYKLFPRSRLFGRERMTWWQRDDERDVDVVTGCFMLVRREAIEQVGVMDEQFFMYAEETDWCYRFRQAGWRLLFSPVGEIIHLGGQSSKRVGVEMTVQLRLSILRFLRKHHGRAYYRLACLLVFAFFAVRIPGWLIVYSMSRGRREQAASKLKAYFAATKRIPLFSGFRGGSDLL